MKPLVSVLVPVHNGTATLERALRSALAQTYDRVEVIVVDDGSSDASWELILAVAETDPRVVPVRRDTASGGPAVPRNAAISHARGDLFALLDQDDHWLPEKLEKQLPEFRDTSVGVVYSDCWTTEGESYLAQVAHLGSPPVGDVSAEILRWNFVPACSAVWRRAMTEAIGLFAEELSSVDDREYWIRAARAGFRFSFVPEQLAVYNTVGLRLSDDAPLHARLVVGMWRQQAESWPDDQVVAGNLLRSRRHLSHVLAWEASKSRGLVKARLLWQALATCPEPRNTLKILSGRAIRRFM